MKKIINHEFTYEQLKRFTLIYFAAWTVLSLASFLWLLWELTHPATQSASDAYTHMVRVGASGTITYRLTRKAGRYLSSKLFPR